jgi:hypothetical protein
MMNRRFLVLGRERMPNLASKAMKLRGTLVAVDLPRPRIGRLRQKLQDSRRKNKAQNSESLYGKA